MWANDQQHFPYWNYPIFSFFPTPTIGCANQVCWCDSS